MENYQNPEQFSFMEKLENKYPENIRQIYSNPNLQRLEPKMYPGPKLNKFPEHTTIKPYPEPEQYPEKFTPLESFSKTGYLGSEPKIMEPIAPDLSDLFSKEDKPKNTNLYLNPIAAAAHVESSKPKRSLKSYRHNFAGQKGAPKGKALNTSSALHQLEHTTSLIGENKQPFQETLDNITNSYGNVSSDSKSETQVIDLDEKDDVQIVEKPTNLK